MRIGVVSDTHNNQANIDLIISIFNEEKVSLVIHTGDITNGRSLEKFSKLTCGLLGVYGNNDRTEEGLKSIVKNSSFDFEEPPRQLTLCERNIAIFHEPESIYKFIREKKDIDIVLHGHTHRYRNEIEEGTLIFNPGESAGMIKGSNAVGVLDLKQLRTKRIFF